jgi:lactoylglutathione lyase
VTWPGALQAITLFVDDITETTEFYARVFDPAVVFADEGSTAYRFGDELIVNLLQLDRTPVLVEPASAAAREDGVRMVLTLGVDDVDRRCVLLAQQGVSLLNGPMDRPWGIRTASFRDPAGHIWEIASALPE